MIRVNHKGVRMDAEDYNTDGLGNVSEVVAHVRQVRQEGMGVISMKLVGEGTFNRDDRKAGDEIRVQERWCRLRYGGLQEHRGDRRGD